MQLQNKLKNLSPGMKLVLLASVLLVVLGIVFLISSPFQKENTDNGEKVYTDPYSGETITETPARTEERFGGEENSLVILGGSTLFDRGVSEDHYRAFQTALTDYAKTNKVSEVSIDSDSVKDVPKDPNSEAPGKTLTFTLVTNRKVKHRAQFDYSGLSMARLRIVEERTATVEYDSGTLDGTPPSFDD